MFRVGFEINSRLRQHALELNWSPICPAPRKGDKLIRPDRLSSRDTRATAKSRPDGPATRRERTRG
jgi:hypothetical protein